MRLKQCLSLLILFPLAAFCQINDSSKINHFLPVTADKNTVELVRSNEFKPSILLAPVPRSLDVPTHIIRTEGSLKGQAIGCDEVLKTISQTFLDPIITNPFIYNTYVSCTHDPDTKLALQFSINSYFDPMNDEAVAFLTTYLAEKNGLDLFGTPVKIEAAKGLVVAINIMAGVKKNPDRPPFMVYRQDRSNFAFQSNYEMKNTLLTDLYAHFYSDKPDEILPFLNRWILPSAEFAYYNVLLDSNYVALQPERIFMMQTDGDIFVSRLRYYFAHPCYKHKHHRCMKLR